MQHLERIVLWSVIAILILFLFFRNSSGFIKAEVNLMDMAEFNGLPDDVKKTYVTNMTMIMGAVNKKFSDQWSALPKEQKTILLNNLTEATKTSVKQIEGVDLMKLATIPPVKQVETKNAPMPQMKIAMPMGPVGMTMSSPAGMDLDKMKMQDQDQAKMKAQADPMGMKTFDPSMMNVQTTAQGVVMGMKTAA